MIDTVEPKRLDLSSPQSPLESNFDRAIVQLIGKLLTSQSDSGCSKDIKQTRFMIIANCTYDRFTTPMAALKNALQLLMLT